MTTEPFIEQMDDEDPSLSVTLDFVIETKIAEVVRGPQPARVISYDASKGCATVLPCFTIRYNNGDEVTPPIISNVPVMQMSGAGRFLSMPLEKGDDVFLLFSERSLDEWKAQGLSEINPQHKRKFDETDAICYPGTKPFKRALQSLSNKDIVLGDSATSGIRVALGDGTVKIGTPTVELLAEIDASLAEVEDTLGQLDNAMKAIAVAAGVPSTPVTTGSLAAFFTAAVPNAGPGLIAQAPTSLASIIAIRALIQSITKA